MCVIKSGFIEIQLFRLKICIYQYMWKCPNLTLDLIKRHAQMMDWIKHGMVPVYKSGHRTPESHGQLRKIWTGGLVNPRALFTALRQEKAVLEGWKIDQVNLVL